MQKRIFLEKKRNFDSIIMDEVMGNRIFTSEESQILEDIMIHRRDVRGNQFIGKEIPSDVLNKILFSAQVAPSVGFSQPWKFVIVQKQEIKQKILNSFQEENDSAANQFEGGRKDQYQKLKLEGIMEAPVNIAVFYEPSDHPVLGQTSMKEAGLYSVVCAIQNMWLMARSQNVGMGWVSIIDAEKVGDILNAPKEHQLVAYLCMGYVKKFYDRPELEQLKWEKRKQLETLVHFDSYPQEDPIS